MSEQIEFPDFDEIKKHCVINIINNFPKYKNSWKCGSMTLKWWEERLKKEVEEIFNADSIKDYVNEISDAITILCMMYSNAVQKCSKCNKSILEWQSLDGKIICTECYFR